MKNVVIGGIGVLSSIILFGMTLISASIYVYLSAEGGEGWNSNLGVFGTSLYNIGFIPLMLCVIFFFIGIYYLNKSIRD